MRCGREARFCPAPIARLRWRLPVRVNWPLPARDRRRAVQHLGRDPKGRRDGTTMSDISARLAGLSPRRRELLLRQLAAKQAPGAADRIPRQPRSPQDTGRFPLSFSQLREWLLEQLDPGTPAYNLPGGARVLGTLDLEALRRAVSEIVRRHESLRTTFQPALQAASGEPAQVVAPEAAVEVPFLDLSALPSETREDEASRLIATERRLPFDLGHGPLLRFFVLRLGPEDHLAP